MRSLGWLVGAAAGALRAAEPEPLRGIPGAWAHTRWARAVRDGAQRGGVFPLLRLFARRVRVRGAAHLDGLTGAAVLAANHPGHFDPMLIMKALPRRLRGRVAVAAGEDVLYQGFNRYSGLGLLATLVMGTFPLPRRGSPREALGRAGKVLDAGLLLLVFPEGGLSPGGVFGRCASGAARLALAHDVPVVPVYIDGAYQIDRPGRLLNPARVRVSFGAPLHAHALADARQGTRQIEQAITGLRDGTKKARQD